MEIHHLPQIYIFFICRLIVIPNIACETLNYIKLCLYFCPYPINSYPSLLEVTVKAESNFSFKQMMDLLLTEHDVSDTSER